MMGRFIVGVVSYVVAYVSYHTAPSDWWGVFFGLIAGSVALWWFVSEKLYIRKWNNENNKR